MFNYIKGQVTDIAPNFVTIDVGGIGYLIKSPEPFSYILGSEVTIFTHVYIREDTFDIFGFKSKEERDFFSKLISVKGIGPKTALAIIAHGNMDALIKAISESNSKYLQSYPGIGQKASSQIILDLRGKLTINDDFTSPVVKDVKDALKSLGFSATEIKSLDKFIIENSSKPVEVLIKECLSRLI